MSLEVFLAFKEEKEASKELGFKPPFSPLSNNTIARAVDNLMLRSTLVAVALVVAVHARGWVDPDTPDASLKTPSLVDGRSFDLVFSDEFSVPGRRFDDGFDPRWTAIHKNDYTNQAVQ